MPKSYLKLQTPPKKPVNDWLLWSASQLDSFIGNLSNNIAGIYGINKAGDLQYIIMPTIVPEALGVALNVLGNSTDASSEPAFVYLDMSNLGYTSVIKTYALIPCKICPDEQLPTKYLKSTTWETVKVPLGLSYKTNSITILSFVTQSDLGKVNAYREAKQVARNKREFDFVKSHCKALKTTIEGLGKIHSLDCFVKTCANVCCVITALFDIRAGNPVPLLYSVCIKTIEVFKHPEFIKWHNKVHDKVLQLPYIFLNTLHKVLSQFASFLTNSVNNSLVEHGVMTDLN